MAIFVFAQATEFYAAQAGQVNNQPCFKGLETTLHKLFFFSGLLQSLTLYSKKKLKILCLQN